MLYLIDTKNGEFSIQRNEIAVSRQTYALADYCSGKVWGEWAHDADGKMPVMTYAGFGSEVRLGRHFPWKDFDYIICDEMQNLVNYQNIKGGNRINLEYAEMALQTVAREEKTRIIALSATPQKIRERFGGLCHNVPFDRSDLFQVETFRRIPYSCNAEDLLAAHKGQTGILYTTAVADMKTIIRYARSIGIRADGFWSLSDDTQLRHPMDEAQLALWRTVLDRETIPEDIDLLVINAASETCIKIKEENRRVEYMIVHNKDREICAQVRGRYHGDLPIFYWHDVEVANRYICRHLPERFLDVRLYAKEQNELCCNLNLRAEHGNRYSMPTVAKYLKECGYQVEKKKDSKRNGQHYYVITAGDAELPF